MFSIIAGLLIVAGGISGHLNILGSSLGVIVMGCISVALGVRKVIRKHKRKQRELAKGSIY